MPALAAAPETTATEVPFVGCKSNGQMEPVDPPVALDRRIELDPGSAGQLAYYKAVQGPGVLAPRALSDVKSTN